MSQNFDHNARIINLHDFAYDHPVGPVAATAPYSDDARWEIRELSAAEEAEFEELTKLFVPFDPDFM